MLKQNWPYAVIGALQSLIYAIGWKHLAFTFHNWLLLLVIVIVITGPLLILLNWINRRFLLKR